MSTSELRRTFQAGRRCAGMTQRDKIVAGALVIVILVCGVIIAKQFFLGSGVDENPDIGFKCSVCGKEWIIPAETLRKQEWDDKTLEEHPERTADQAHCPHCGAKHAGLLMIQCPECEKWFPLAGTNIRTDPDAEANSNCPHCGLDLMEWKRKHP